MNSSNFKGGIHTDSITVYRRAGSLVMRSRHSSRSHVTATVEQMRNRACFRNQVNLWRTFPKECRPMFEGRRAGVTDYNMFVSHNMQCGHVYLTRREAENGACVLTPVAVSDGTLPPIVLSHDGVAPVTDLAVGALTVDAGTTVAALSAAIVRGNGGYCFGDELVFFLGLQQWNTRLGLPEVAIHCTRLVLSSVDRRTVYDATAGGMGFAVRGGRLAAASEVQGGMAWVHVRRRGGDVLLSSQHMLCSNPFIARYSGREALEAACRSYGVKLERPFLVPDGGAAGCYGV